MIFLHRLGVLFLNIIPMVHQAYEFSISVGFVLLIFEYVQRFQFAVGVELDIKSVVFFKGICGLFFDDFFCFFAQFVPP